MPTLTTPLASTSRLTFWRSLDARLAVHELDDFAAAAPLLPGEAHAIRTASPARRAEFAAGRHCARSALTSLGAPRAAIAVGPLRAPAWPRGFTGSITHVAGYAAAVVGPRSGILGIGIDAEVLGALTSDLWPTVLTPAEQAALPVQPLDALALAAVAFSAKECVHKVVAPATGVMLDFHDARVSVAPNGNWTACLEGSAPAWPGVCLRGRWYIDAGLVLCGLVVTAADVSPGQR